MTTDTIAPRPAVGNAETSLQLVTFRVAEMLFGISIEHIEEINRQVEFTPVARAPGCVCGVINLRGRVVTILSLRKILGLPPATSTRASRTVIVKTDEEAVGLLVDSVADVVEAECDAIDSPPANVKGVDSKYFDGVYKTDGELLVILDVEQVVGDDATTLQN